MWGLYRQSLTGLGTDPPAESGALHPQPRLSWVRESGGWLSLGVLCAHRSHGLIVLPIPGSKERGRSRVHGALKSNRKRRSPVKTLGSAQDAELLLGNDRRMTIETTDRLTLQVLCRIVSKASNHGGIKTGVNHLEAKSRIEENLQPFMTELHEMPWHFMDSKTEVSFDADIPANTEYLGNFFCNQPRHGQMLKNRA